MLQLSLFSNKSTKLANTQYLFHGYLSTEKKKKWGKHEYEPNLYKTYNPKQNSDKLSAIYSALFVLHSDLQWMKDVVKSEYLLHILCLQFTTLKLYTGDIFTSLSISFY